MKNICSICGSSLYKKPIDYIAREMVCESCWCKNCSKKDLITRLDVTNNEIYSYENAIKKYQEFLKDLKKRKSDIEKIMKDRNFQE